jgi:hypothetical protein
VLKAPPTPATVRITMRSNPSQNRTKLLQQCSCAFLLFPVAYVWSAPWPNLLAVHVWDCFQRRHSSGALATHRPSVTSLRTPEDTPGLSRLIQEGSHTVKPSQSVQHSQPVALPRDLSTQKETEVWFSHRVKRALSKHNHKCSSAAVTPLVLETILRSVVGSQSNSVTIILKQ